MTYRLGKRSMRELVGVHPGLVDIVERALSRSPVDFMVFDGLRTVSEQAEYVQTGVSQTMKSMHLKQADGWGHAVDLVPYINGKARWELGPCGQIAEVVREAAEHHNIRVRWGGCWMVLNGTMGLGGMDLVDLYTARKRASGRQAFIDGPHFEILV